MFVTQALRMAADLSLYYSVAGLLTLAKGGTAAAPFWNLFLLCVFFALSCLLSLKTKAWRDGPTGSLAGSPQAMSLCFWFGRGSIRTGTGSWGI